MPSNRVRAGHGTDEAEAVPSLSSNVAIKLVSRSAAPVCSPLCSPTRAQSNTMSFKPTSIAQDAVASTSESDSAPESSNHPKPKRPRFQKPKPEYLESLGIKIKDFAYEKTNLPPIKIVFRHPLQIQPAVPRTIQRSSTEPDAGNASQDSQGMRQPTEPVIMPAATEQIADDDPSSQESTTSPIPEEILFSQASGAVIDTPPVTPNGSLQWGTRFANYAPV